VDEVFKGNRPIIRFSKPSWRNIEANFKKNIGKEYPRIKFKYKWDTLKKDWVAWNKLKGSETGLEWDAVTTQIRNMIRSRTGMLIPSLCLILTKTN
jgi:hypothetical protein